MRSHRRVAAAAAFALTTTTLTAGAVLGAAPATAAEPEAFTWAISQQYVDHLSTRVLSDGATESAGVFSFPALTQDIDPSTGAGTASYDGSVSGSFAFGGTTYYTVTLADPIVSVDADGEGEISAVVSASNAAAQGSEADSTDPTRVVVTTFDADGGWTDGTLSATPHWEGVLPEGAESVALGIGAGKPVDGKSFAPSFLGQLTSGVRAHFYASGSGSDVKKAPAAFTAIAPAPEPEPEKTVSTTASYGARGVTLKVEAAGGFSADEGDVIYVGLAAGRTLPDVSTWDESQFAAANLVAKDAIVDGAFTSTLTAPAKVLDPRKKYSLFTWLGHRHTSTSQDTVTPVTVNWAKITPAVKTKVAAKPTVKKAGKLAVTLTGKNGKAAGKVTLALKKGKSAKSVKATVKQGKATVKLPKLAKGTWKVTTTYAGSSAYVGAKSQRALTVR